MLQVFMRCAAACDHLVKAQSSRALGLGPSWSSGGPGPSMESRKLFLCRAVPGDSNAIPIFRALLMQAMADPAGESDVLPAQDKVKFTEADVRM